MKWILVEHHGGGHGAERPAAKLRNEAGGRAIRGRARPRAAGSKTVARRRYLILSIVCLAFSFFAFMALVQARAAQLRRARLRGQLHPGDGGWRNWCCKEQVGTRRAAGAVLVLGGIILLAR